MMNTPLSMALGHPVNDLSHEKICIWLKHALQGEEPLPQLTADEHPHLGILRLEKTLWPTTRRSISDGCLELIRQFSADGQGDDAYLQELLFLTAGFKILKQCEYWLNWRAGFHRCHKSPLRFGSLHWRRLLIRRRPSQ